MTITDLSLVECSVTDDRFIQFIEALKVNTTLTKLKLGGTFNLCHVLSLIIIIDVMFFFVFKLLYVANGLGNDGVKYIADVLKVNTTLTSIKLHCEAFLWFFFFSFVSVLR